MFQAAPFYYLFSRVTQGQIMLPFVLNITDQT